MCMKNINAIAEIDALDKNGRLITILNEKNMEKTLPLDTTNKFLISFSYSIIDGTVKFFSTNKKLYFQLRITNKEGKSIPEFALNEYTIDLENCNSKYTTDLVDFIYEKDMCIKDFNIENINSNDEYYLNVLVKTEQDLRNDDNWTIQSVTPLHFKQTIKKCY